MEVGGELFWVSGGGWVNMLGWWGVGVLFDNAQNHCIEMFRSEEDI